MRSTAEVASRAVGPPQRRWLGRVGRRRAVQAVWLLRSVEGVVYWLAVAPLAARLPACLAYRVACWRGNWDFRYRAGKCSEIVRNLCQVLGDELGPAEAERLARDSFRIASCEAIDVMRLRGHGRSLGRLVEIRGRDHLEAALTGGNGAILCSAHFGSYNSGFSLLHASGFPLTTIGRWQYKYTAGLSQAERWFWDFVYARRVRRYRQRPNIEPWPGQVQVAVQAAVALRANEVVTISIDAPPTEADQAHTAEVVFLGQRARLLPGVVTLARLTHAPVLMAFLYRSADCCHQVLEISAPVPMEGETLTAFGRCVSAVDAAITRSPAHWAYWASTADLVSLGLLPAASSAHRPPTADPAL